MSNLLKELEGYKEDLKGFRHYMHQHPELSFKEEKTAEYIAGLLKSWGYEVTTNIGKTGVVARMKLGDGKASIGLRADTDALPVQEVKSSDHKSQNEGVSHACGHDGHSAMLLGAAKYLAEKKCFNGTLNLIFQPAEEVMGGALAMIEDGLFEKFPMDYVFGLHNMPGLQRGKLVFKEGPIMAAVDNWEIELTGKGTHGSMPENGIDPVVAGASLVMALQTIVSRNVAPKSSAVVTIGAFIAGDAGNVIPQTAILRLSVRNSDSEVRKLVLDKIRSITKAQAEAFNVGYEIRESVAGAVLFNDIAQTEVCANIAKQIVGEENVDTNGPTFMGSEDFAFMAQKRPGTYAFVGGGDDPMVHHPMYDFDDNNLPIGAAYWVGLAQGYLK